VPDMEIYHQALDARDARFDGIFFVGITSTGIYCRPVCPAKVSYPDRRRFFSSAAAAEQAGYRPCLRCRPELAPGRAIMDAVPRLATVAAHRISAGALNGHGVPELARELGVSERHLRRALEREIGVSPVELAQTCRLLLAKRLLAETSLPVTRIAYASGFQSLRRFNAIFRERYRMSPLALRRGTRGSERSRPRTQAETERDFIRLSLAYRAPLDWLSLLRFLRSDAVTGVEIVEEGRYGRTVALGGRTGIVLIENRGPEKLEVKPGQTQSLTVGVSPSLLPALMPLLVRIRQILDLDSEPSVVDGHLERNGLASLVDQHPGLRIPGALDGFEAAFRILLRERGWPLVANSSLASQVASALGTTVESGIEGLSLIMPDAARVAESGVSRLVGTGVPVQQADVLMRVARAIADGSLRLEQGCDVAETRRALLDLNVCDDLATMIIMQARPWPDAFPAGDPVLLRSARESNARRMEELYERCRPWRAYAAYHLWLQDMERQAKQAFPQAGPRFTAPAVSSRPLPQARGEADPERFAYPRTLQNAPF
jgi:AraC family transcriptional regulator of adaptative response / DNA-3-methyladenine glycosylase II